MTNPVTFDRADLADLAAAGLPFVDYELGDTDTLRPLHSRLFPKHRDNSTSTAPDPAPPPPVLSPGSRRSPR